MVKYFDNRSFAKVKRLLIKIQQKELLHKIFEGMDPIGEFEQQMKNEESVLLKMMDLESVKRIHGWLARNMEQNLEKLERLIRNGENTQFIEGEMLRVLKIHRRLYKNSTYKEMDEEVFGPLLLRVLIWSSMMALSEETLRIISQFSFDKSLKLYYYYFKYYMSHLNLYYPDELKIKHLFIQNQNFNFGFLCFKKDAGHESSLQVRDSILVNIPDLCVYFKQRKLENVNHFTGAKQINRDFDLNLDENDERFHALMTKIRMFLTKDRNSLIRSVMYSYWVFSLVDIALLRSDDKLVGIPDIFDLPPDYTRILQEFFQVFFQGEAEPQTHLAILTLIDSILALEEQKGSKQFLNSVNENTPQILKLLECIATQISPYLIVEQNEQRVPETTIRNKQVMEKLFYVLARQIVEATQLHSLSEELALSIFMKRCELQVSQKTIESCGLILITVEADQEELLNFVIERLRVDKQKAHGYLKVVNQLFESKYVRQRRDFSTIARVICESEIFTILLPILEDEMKSCRISKNSMCVTTMVLIGNICSQNPSLIDLISKNEILDGLLNFCISFRNVENSECISLIINFIHYICLKQGEIRDKVMKNYVDTFLRRVFTSNLHIYIKQKSFGGIITSINKFISNIGSVSLMIYCGIVCALKDLNSQCKNIKDIEFYMKVGTVVTKQVLGLVEKIRVFDSKLIFVLKSLQKCKDMIFSRIGIKSMYVMYKRLIKLCFVRGNVFIDIPFESRCLINLIHEIRMNCQKLANKRRNNFFEENVNNNVQKQNEFLSHLNSNQGEIENTQGVASILARNSNIEKQIQQREQGGEEMLGQQRKQMSMQNEGDDKKTLKQVNYFNSQIKKLCDKIRQCLQNKNYNVNKPIRKFSDIFIQETEISQSVYLELQVSFCFSKLDKIILYLNKQLLPQIITIPQYMNICLDAQMLLPNIIEMVSLLNVQIMNSLIFDLKNIHVQTTILRYRSQNNKIISQEMFANELHNKLMERLSCYHLIVESVVKCVSIFTIEFKDRFLEIFVNKVVHPLTVHTQRIVNEIEMKQEGQISILDFERLRYSMKIYLQLFFEIHNDGSDYRIKSPFNHIFMFYNYQIDEPKIYGIFTRILNILVKYRIDMLSNLCESSENRVILLKRIIFKMIRNRIKQFISRSFQMQSNDLREETDQVMSQEKKGLHGSFLYVVSKILVNYGEMNMGIVMKNDRDSINMQIVRDQLSNRFQKIIELKQVIEGKIEHPLKKIDLGKNVSRQKFDGILKLQASKLYNWMMGNLHRKLTKMDFYMFLGLGVEKMMKQTQGIKDMNERSLTALRKDFYELCEEIVVLSKRIFNDYNLHLNLPRRHNEKLQRSVLRKIQQEYMRREVRSVRQDVMKLGNAIKILSQQIETLLKQKIFNENEIKINNNFMMEIVKFVSEVIGNYEIAQGEDKYKVEADLLAHRSIGLLRNYGDYSQHLRIHRDIARKQKRRMLRRQKLNNVNRKTKTERKRLKRLSKNIQEQGEGKKVVEDFQNYQQMQNVQRNERLHRQKSEVDLNQPMFRQETGRSHNKISKKKKQTEKGKKKHYGKSSQKLSRAVQGLICNILAASQVDPFLKGSTLHEIMTFINKNREDQRDEYKNIYIIEINQIIGLLLRTRICEIKHRGFFHKLAEIGVKFIGNVEKNVNIEIGVKRLFFEANSRQIPLRELLKRIEKADKFGPITPVNLSHILQIKLKNEIDSESDKSLQQKKNEKPHEKAQVKSAKQLLNSDKKGQQKRQQQKQNIVQFNTQNIIKYKQNKNAYAILLFGVELNYVMGSHMIVNNIVNNNIEKQRNVQFSNKKDRDRKSQSSILVDDDRKNEEQLIKSVDFVPNKNLQNFIFEIVNNIARLITRSMFEIENAQQNKNKNEIEQENLNKESEVSVDNFNITVLIEVLQVLLRECPCLAPFITKYKCRKIIIQNMEGLGKKSKQILSNLLNLQERKEITLLAFLIRAVCPLFFNRVFTLLFEMCLDNPVLQVLKPFTTNMHVMTEQNEQNLQIGRESNQENNKDKEIGGFQQTFVTFGHVVRQRALSEIQNEIFRSDSFIRKMSIINLMTMLFSIKQFSKLCIESPGLIKSLQGMYVDTLRKLKDEKLGNISIIAKRVLIPYYISPVNLLLEINISLNMQKKDKRKNPRISFFLLKESIQQQLIPSQFFHATKFKHNWPYISANEINLGFDENGLNEDYDEQSVSNSQNSLDSSQIQRQEQDINQFLEQAIQQNDQGQNSEISEQHELQRNSWISHDVVDSLMDIEEQDNEDNSDENDDDDENGGYGNRRVTLELYPNQDSNQDGQDDDQQRSISGSYVISSNVQNLDDGSGQEYGQIQGISSLEELDENSANYSQFSRQLFQNMENGEGRIRIELSSNMQNDANYDSSILNRVRNDNQRLGKDFDDAISHDRGDPKNCIYNVERQQEATIRIFLLLFSTKDERLLKEYKKLSQKQKQMIIKLKKIDKNDPGTIQEHDRCLFNLIDDPELIQLAENIEFKNYQIFESFFSSGMSPQEDNQYQQENGLQRRTILGFDSLIVPRGRARRHGLIRQQGIRIPVSELNFGDRRPLIPFDISQPQQLQIQIQNVDDENESDEDVEQEVGDQVDQDESEQQEGNQDQNIEMYDEIIQEGDGGLDLERLFHGVDQNDQYMGMSREEVNTALQNQGFSMQNFLNLPIDIRNDILHNIRMQNANPNGGEQVMEVENRELQQQNEMEGQGQGQEGEHPNTPIMNIQQPNQVVSPVQNQKQNEEQFSQQYKKFSNNHVKKINKDIIYLLNKEGKNDNKFTESTDEFIESVLELIYLLNQNDHIYFPFNLVASMCVNSVNETRILSNLISILMLGPKYKEKQGKLPKTIFSNNQGQLRSNYQKGGFSDISLKVLHMLLHLSKSYSISMSMMHVQNKPTLNMDTGQIKKQLDENTLLQNLMNLLQYRNIKEEPLNLAFLIDIINNVTSIKFNYHIHQLVTGKNKKENEKQGELKDKIDRSRDASLQLTDQNNGLLFSLIESNFLRENISDSSKIIMRLSIDEKNLNNFVHFFKKIIRNMANKITKSLVQTFQKYGAQKNLANKHSFKERTYKNFNEPIIVQMMTIFYDIIKSMKTSIITQEKHSNLLAQFRQILECQEVKNLCQEGSKIIEQNPSSPQILPKIHEFLDCFFAIFNILQDKNETHEKHEQKQSGQNSIITKRNIPIKRKFSSNFIDLENLFENKICTTQGKVFINANIRNKLNSILKGNRRFKDSLFELPIIVVALEVPHMLQFDNKKSLFKAEIKRIKQKKAYETVQMLIQRKDVFQQSFTQIMNRRAEDLKGKLKIEFEGEEGEDVGGLTREWFQLLSKQMFNPDYALFAPSSTGSTYHPSPKSYANNDHLNYFRFIGRVMGKALHDGFMLDAYFTPAFYKHILEMPITYEDMEEEDFEYYKSMKWILENSPIQDFMQLNFTYEFDNFGEIKTQNLVPNGNQLQVTEQNKKEYVQLVSYAKMAKSVQKQYQNLLQGFHEFIPAKLIKIFDEKQLEVMISGLPTVDIEDLRVNTDLVNYNKTDQIIIWLFEVLQGFDMSLRTSFLQFVTGTSRVPPEGFKSLQGFNGAQKFNIHKYYDTKHLPRSHTCFNQLDLPPYESKQMLLQKLTLAITEGKQGFGIL